MLIDPNDVFFSSASSAKHAEHWSMIHSTRNAPCAWALGTENAPLEETVRRECTVPNGFVPFAA